MVKAFFSVLFVAALVGGTLSGCSRQAAAPLPSDGFGLHIDAKKHINVAPDAVVHHFCKETSSPVIQCLLFDNDSANARLIGVETVISEQLYASLPDAEKPNWHYHKTEIPQVEATLPGLSEQEAQKVLDSLQETWGKVIIFWEPQEPAPITISVTRPH